MITQTSYIFFITVCTKYRLPWLASDKVHDILEVVWQNATAWMVGRYVIMPDHLHLFAAPGKIEIPMENWIKFWKSQFTKKLQNKDCRWQAGYWDRRIRTFESYDSKWEYVRRNPVRHGLVDRVEDWPYQGVIFNLFSEGYHLR